jgi:ribosomal protein L17
MAEKRPVLTKYMKELEDAQMKTKALENAHKQISGSDSFSELEKESIKAQLIKELKRESECLRQIDERTKIYNELHDITTNELEKRNTIIYNIEQNSTVFELFPDIRKRFKETQCGSLNKVKQLIDRNEK